MPENHHSSTKFWLWVKKTDPEISFDMVVKAFNGTDICDLVKLYILVTLIKSVHFGE